MHISYKALLLVFCATFSAPLYADDFVSLVEENFPYQEVEESYGVASIEAGNCQEGTPFVISQERSQSSTKMDVAKWIHEKLRGLGANAFAITDLQEDTRVRSITVTPLTCDLR